MKEKTWVRGINITVSPEAHKFLKRKSFNERKSIRELLDEMVEEAKKSPPNTK